MYEAFYGLTGKPFQLSPDPKFYFDSRQHRKAMAYLQYGLHQNEGFIVVTGEVGAGKTTLVRSLFQQLDAEQVVAANLVSTQLSADGMLSMVASAFGIPTDSSDKPRVLRSIEVFLASVAQEDKRCLLVVDEAQNLSAGAVEELRMLSNFQLGNQALLQSFLIGQAEFRHVLQKPAMRQLRQRVIAACHIGPMDMEDTRAYIQHRLAHAGAGGEHGPQFESGAYERVFAASGGVPRRVNSLCDRVLLGGFLAERRTVSAGDVDTVAAQFEEELASPDADVDAAHAVADQGLPELSARLARLEVGLQQLESNSAQTLALLHRPPATAPSGTEESEKG